MAEPTGSETSKSSVTWNKVKESIRLGTLRAVGLEPTAEEKRHWIALTGTIETRQQRKPKAPPTSSLTHREAAALKRLTGIHKGEERGGAYSKGTGRNVALKSQLKPDLWRIALNSVRGIGSHRTVPTQAPTTGRSFYELEDEPGFDAPDGAEDQELDEDFYGTDTIERGPPSLAPRVAYDGDDETDSVPMLESPMMAIKPLPETKETKNKIGQRFTDKLQEITLSGGYDRGYGGLGFPTHLLQFKYHGLNDRDKKRLDNQILHKRPFFTYWLMLVQFIIMIVALSVYGIAIYSWDLVDVRETILQPDGNYEVQSKSVVGNVWLGPSQQSLIVLGALYAPCMRWDRGLMAVIEEDIDRETNSSGCCVRLDRGGCYQTLEPDCSNRFNDWRFTSDDGSERAVCGTSPSTCTDPDPDRFPGSYRPLDISTWSPICRAATNATEDHLICEVTAHPCCYGSQAICTITTRESCEFLSGRFHQDAFLCSQVDCLNNICGLLPFATFNQPDQIYRLFLALFLHAGLIHLLFSLIFDFFVLRHVEKRLGWWRTAIIYILSGIGGNMVSAYFVPYYPEAGPAGSILGIVAYFFVFLIFESPHLKRPWVEALKLLIGVLVPLLLIGLLPFVDNFAHIGGFVFGFLLSGIFVPYWSEKQAWQKVESSKHSKEYRTLYQVKIAMIVLGIPLVIGLFLLFLLLFYLYQTSWVGFSFLNCVPFSPTFCIDNLPSTRDRNAFII